MNNSSTITLNDASFEKEVLQVDSQPVLVDFWAEWCSPCKVITPILEEVAQKYQGKIKIGKLNVDENPNTPAKYGVRGIPTLILFKDGKALETKVGALSKSQLEAFLDKHLA
ncbi:thioredoxin TrxA [Rickettsiella endosymbiont of Litargus connexus]|jgi:thioredoxin 1|uniref:thioredoxin TrxA n=1 Tax=Rickettsiella endosymbiont of Litargus connexus TaxID=3066237 RepID=UPI0027FDC1AC|nr:thioredoxin TrxA [Gammaproteobacteria bacterium]MDQ5900168.1 thioredoxin 1 [Pseudomonadota bacterium]